MKKTGKKLLTLLLALVMVLGMLAVPALAADAIPYTGDKLNSIAADGSDFDTFEPMSGTSAYIIDNDVVIHYVLKDDTYKALHLGSITDQDRTRDVEFNDDNTFDLTVSTSNIQKAIPFAPIKADGSTTDTQYYLAIPAGLPVRTALEITNNTAMFKALTAYIEVDGEETFLVMALSGTGYANLFKGTYEQAVANGDNSSNWIAGATNSAGALEFRIPVAAGETTIPLVAISNSYYTKYLNSENSLERAFYPRQAVLDLSAKTLVTGDYASSRTIQVTNNTTMFKVKTTSQLEIVGGPNSNNYKASLALAMVSTSFDKAYVGRASDITDSTALISIDENQVFELPVKWVATAGKPESLVSLMDAPFVVSFRSASKGTWSERQFTLSETDGTLVIDKVSEESGSGSGSSGGTETPAPVSSFDNSTDLPDGTYAVSAENYSFTNTDHETPKSKITCESVTVTDGKAMGTFSVSSANMTHVYLANTENSLENANLYDPSTGKLGTDVYAISEQKVTIPVKLNAETPIAARTTAMSNPSWVNYLYTITLTAAGGSGEGGLIIPAMINASVSISVGGQFVKAADGSTVAAAPVLATDLDNSGDVTIDEVLTAAHEAYYPGGASAGYASSVGSWGLGMDMLWGDTSYNFGYYVDNAMAWSLADTVKDGGHVQAWVYQDAEYYSDAYAYFDKLSAEAADGTVTLTLIASQGYDETTYAPIFAPYAGASVTVDGQATGLVTDSQGKVTLSFDASGTYLISAVGKDGAILVPPVCLVTATVTAPLTVNALVSISVAGQFVKASDGSTVAAAPVQATDRDGSGDITIDEVLYAAHETYYPGGAAAGYASSVGSWGLGMDMLWGDTSYNFGYYVDNAMAWSLADAVKEGGHVQAWVYQDAEYYSDAYAYFDKLTTRALSGSITLTLYSASYDENWNVVFAPYADAAVTIDGKATGLVTDSQGKVTLTFDESGTYLVSAAGKDGEILVPPVSLVTATVSSGSQDSRIDLEITNNTGMFKGEYAYVETVDGVSTLVVALTGQTYRYLIPGTYAQAVNNGTDRSSWIAGQQDENGKWFFRIPLRSGQTYIPVVSVSQTYLDKYEAGENPLERSYYPRQFELDMDAGTLTIGDYDTNIRFSVLSDLSTFQATSSTMVHVVGGPNSNNYSLSFSLKVMDGTYDQVTYPTVVDGAISEATASLSGGAFAIEIKNAPTLTAFQDRTPIQMGFRLAETGNDTVIPVTIDLLAQTITIGSYSGSASGSSDSQAPQIVTADLTVSAEVINGTAEAVLSAETVTAAIEKEQEADVLAVYVESKGADTVELTLDNLAVKVVAGTNTALSVETEQGTLTVSKDEMEKLSKAGGDVALSLSVNKDGSMTLDVTANGKTADVTVKAALPAVEGSQVLVLVKEDGTEEVIRKSLVEDGTAYANLPAGCTVKAVDGSREFEDVSDTNWFAHYVDFVSSHRLFTGVTETEFKPGEPMTRAMLAMVLFRLESEPENASAGSIKFDDVKDDSWYADAVDWAAGFGVFVGRENGFAPNASITRQEMATALYRYVKALGLDTETKGSLENYNDGSSVASWAQDAMTWAVGVGLFEGDDTGSLNPGSNATRAEVAALTARLVKLLVK